MFKTKIAVTLSATTIAVALSTSVFAKEQIISDIWMPGDSNSKWVAGVHVGVVENPLIGEDSDAESYVTPTFEYRGEKFFVGKGQLGYNLFRSEGLSVGVLLTGHGTLLSDDDFFDDNTKLVGVKERDATADAGLYLVHNSVAGQFRARALEEITGEHNGHSFDASYTFNMEAAGWRINPFVSAVYQSSDRVNHFYGVSEQEANSNSYLTAYKADHALNMSVGVNTQYDFSENWQFSTGVQYTKLGTGIRDSSLVEDDKILSAHMGVAYNF